MDKRVGNAPAFVHQRVRPIPVVAEGKELTVRIDPENNEIRTLFEMADLTGKHVLEIGCGDGRLTRGYANAAVHVAAIEPFEESIGRAKSNLPEGLQDRVEFVHSSFEDFAAVREAGLFDLVILSKAL
jgi:2-polyprenyl-3-methyl-5-hydroxy-6-metoxy-1,4-benzoquinol methylase